MNSLEFTKSSVLTKRSNADRKRFHHEDNSYLEDEDEPELDEDEFEKEMLQICEERLLKAEVEGGIKSSSATLNPNLSSISIQEKTQNTNTNAKDKLYDDVYFDSDEDSNGDCNLEGFPSSSNTTDGKQNKQVLSNEELMYDPNLDDEDQAWVDNIRKSYRGRGNEKR